MTRILILCTGNSCRSQMAIGFLRAIDANLDVQSAGTNPTSAVNPYAIKAMAEVDIDLNNEQPKSVELYLKEEWDFYSTTAFQTSDVRFLVNTSVHSAGRTTGNEEPESFSLG